MCLYTVKVEVWQFRRIYHYVWGRQFCQWLCYTALSLACNGVYGLWTVAHGDWRRASSWPQFRLHVTFLMVGRLNTITSRGSKGCLLYWLYQWLFLTCSLHPLGKTLFLLFMLFLSRPGCRDWVIGLLFTCWTAGLLLTFHDLISSFLPIVVARCFFTFPAPSPSFLSLLSPSRTFRSRLLTVLLASGLFCMLPVTAWTPGPGNQTYFHLPDCRTSSRDLWHHI